MEESFLSIVYTVPGRILENADNCELVSHQEKKLIYAAFPKFPFCRKMKNKNQATLIIRRRKQDESD
jgi:hypothetical protein